VETSEEQWRQVLARAEGDISLDECGIFKASKPQPRPRTIIPNEKTLQKFSAMLDTPTKNEKLCKIWFERDYDTIFLPCGHIVACEQCATGMTKCPICKTILPEVKRVFFA